MISPKQAEERFLLKEKTYIYEVFEILIELLDKKLSDRQFSSEIEIIVEGNYESITLQSMVVMAYKNVGWKDVKIKTIDGVYKRTMFTFYA
jgi:hypothetical protein